MAGQQVPEDFVSGLEGVVAFTTDIAEPDKDGGALRYRGVDIEDLVAKKVTFGNVWALLVDGRFGPGLPPASTFRPVWRCLLRSGDTSRCSTSTTPRPAISSPVPR